MNPLYKKALQIAKRNRITTVSELQDLLYIHYPDCNGGEFECAKKILKLKY